jgi:hypothetical protein
VEVGIALNTFEFKAWRNGNIWEAQAYKYAG